MREEGKGWQPERGRQRERGGRALTLLAAAPPSSSPPAPPSQSTMWTTLTATTSQWPMPFRDPCPLPLRRCSFRDSVQAPAQFPPPSPTHSRYINNFDGAMNYRCPADSSISYLYSVHYDRYEDRVWKVHCARHTRPSYARMSCSWTGVRCVPCRPLP